MKIENIIEKGTSGNKLTSDEIELLMLHAIELLKFIETETIKSINLRRK